MGVEEDIEARARTCCWWKGLGWNLVDVQFRPEENGWVLRFFIDKEGGFGLKIAWNGATGWGTLVEDSGLISRRLFAGSVVSRVGSTLKETGRF
jgi:hypothetical protein